MNILLKQHLRIIIWLLSCVFVYTSGAVLLDYLFSVAIPPEVLLFLLSICLAFDTWKRFLFWSQRTDYLSPSEISSTGAKIFLTVIPIEIFLAILCICSMFA